MSFCKASGLCKASGCKTRKQRPSGYCNKHDAILKYNGKIERNGCAAPECYKEHCANGYCQKHMWQIKRHGRLTPETEHHLERFCEADGCFKRALFGKMLCRGHDQQMQKHGCLNWIRRPKPKRLVDEPIDEPIDEADAEICDLAEQALRSIEEALIDRMV